MLLKQYYSNCGPQTIRIRTIWAPCKPNGSKSMGVGVRNLHV